MADDLADPCVPASNPDTVISRARVNDDQLVHWACLERQGIQAFLQPRRAVMDYQDSGDDRVSHRHLHSALAMRRASDYLQDARGGGHQRIRDGPAEPPPGLRAAVTTATR